jgi:ferritin-like metal-binding protein YciE
MTSTEDKIVQQLTEARAMELALVRTLQAHIAMTPSGGYRGELERHLRETRDHAERISRRLADTVVRRLDRLSPARLRQVEAYERAHRRRRTVIEASERRRAAKSGSGTR